MRWRGDLRVRTLSAVVLGVPCIGAILAGGWWLAALAAPVALLAALEWRALTAPEGGVADWGFAGACALAPPAALAGGAGATLAVCALAALAALARNGERDWSGAWNVLGVLPAALAPAALVLLREVPEGGLALVLWVLGVVVATDVGAYLVGRTLGGVRLAPALSPAKTRSGAVGGAGCAALAGVLAAPFLPWAAGMSGVGVLAIASLGLSVVAQAGDLFESALKRRAGVKDSGRIIPGHGGVLDRIDALVAAVLATAAVLAVAALAVAR